MVQSLHFPVGDTIIFANLELSGAVCSANLPWSTSTLSQLRVVRRLWVDLSVTEKRDCSFSLYFFCVILFFLLLLISLCLSQTYLLCMPHTSLLYVCFISTFFAMFVLYRLFSVSLFSPASRFCASLSLFNPSMLHQPWFKQIYPSKLKAFFFFFFFLW